MTADVRERKLSTCLFFDTFWKLQAPAEVSGVHDDSLPSRIYARIQNVPTVSIPENSVHTTVAKQYKHIKVRYMKSH